VSSVNVHKSIPFKNNLTLLREICRDVGQLFDMNDTISIPCAFCKGSGVRILSDESTATLKVLKKLGRASRVRVHQVMQKNGDIPATASVTMTYKRMKSLWKRGLVRPVDQRGPAKKGQRGWAGFFEVV